MRIIVLKEGIKNGLKQLGLGTGDKVIVHSSLGSIGKVEGGAATVSDAILEVIGSAGTLVVPTFSCPGDVFDPLTSHTTLGAIADEFWQREGVLRSCHPTHSVAVFGKNAEVYIKDHEKAPTAYAEGTPYYKLAQEGGYILLLGVDQDRNTMLHTAEALASLPYLETVNKKYLKDGVETEIKIEKMAGPHRAFIGLDKLFREKGIMTIGKIGNAVCRLIKAKEMLEITVELLKKNPAACLCSNPACKDCLLQIGKIREDVLRKEDFKLGACLSEAELNSDKLINELKIQGIKFVQFSASCGEKEVIKNKLKEGGIFVSALSIGDSGLTDKHIAVAKYYDCRNIVMNSIEAGELKMAVEKAAAHKVNILLENSVKKSDFYDDLLKEIANPGLGFAFSPAEFAKCKEKPFLKIFHKKRYIKKAIQQLYLEDATFEGKNVPLEQGNGEIKELFSILRTASFSGFFVLRSGDSASSIRSVGSSFWRMLEEM